MEENKQKQTAGDNSTQIQAGVVQYITNVTGIDEPRAREICREEYAIARQDMTSEALSIADSRVRVLEDKLMPKMVQYDKSLSFFADPSFQVSLRKAQIAAACSERESDCELLSELLVHRVEQNSNRNRRLGIVKAIEIVDQIEDSALIGLSMVYALSKFTPTSVVMHEGFRVLNQLYGRIMAGRKLPEGVEWEEHLDLLSAVRIQEKDLHHFKKLEEYIPEQLKVYFEEGLHEDSDDFKLLKERFEKALLPINCFIQHPLKPGYMFLATPRDVESVRIIKSFGQSSLQIPLNAEQKSLLRDAMSMACKEGKGNQELVHAFWQEWDKYECLGTIHKWWNTIPMSFSFTPVGVALANAYIHGKDPSIPSLY